MPAARNGAVWLIVLLLALFLAGAWEVMIAPLTTGDVYPPYSSLRTDPLGAKALFESLSEQPGVDVSRLYKPRSPLDSQTTLLILGVNSVGWSNIPKPVADEYENLLKSGGRIVIAFVPTRAPKMPPQYGCTRGALAHPAALSKTVREHEKLRRHTSRIGAVLRAGSGVASSGKSAKGTQPLWNATSREEPWFWSGTVFRSAIKASWMKVTAALIARLDRASQARALRRKPVRRVGDRQRRGADPKISAGDGARDAVRDRGIVHLAQLFQLSSAARGTSRCSSDWARFAGRPGRPFAPEYSDSQLLSACWKEWIRSARVSPADGRKRCKLRCNTWTRIRRSRRGIPRDLPRSYGEKMTERLEQLHQILEATTPGSVEGHPRTGRRDRSGAHRDSGAPACADRRRAGNRQDPARAHVGPAARLRVRAHPVHARSDARRHHRNQRFSLWPQRIHAGEGAGLHLVSAGR